MYDPKLQPTDLQIKWLRALDKLTNKLGRKPLARELAAHMGQDSPSAATEMIARLEKNGWVKVTRIVRWDITAKAREWL